MAKGQKRSNKETKKPKQDKAAKSTAAPTFMPKPHVSSTGNARKK